MKNKLKEENAFSIWRSDVGGQRSEESQQPNVKCQTQKGITLIALIITVIILLILAGTAISISINGGDLFGKSQNAVAQYNNRVAEENTALTELWGILDSMEGGIKQVNDANPGVLEGNGSEADPYTINCIEDLVAFAYNVNSGTSLYEGKTVALALDLDFQNDKSYANPETKYVLGDTGYVPNESGTAIKTLLTDTSGVGFIPVGNGKSDGFAGIFDGQNHALISLYENSSTFGGLFGMTKNDIIINNLNIKSCNIATTSNNQIGGILGLAVLTATVAVDNCHNINSVLKNASYIGGIVGLVNSKAVITNCNSIDCKISNARLAGGILSLVSSQATITNCHNTSKVSGTELVGGIIGSLSSSSGVIEIINCNNTGEVISDGVEGGIIGIAYSTVTIKDCYNTSDVSGTGPVGGIIGIAYSTVTIKDCYNTGDVTNSGTNQAGGILGQANSNTTVTITNCYNTGDVSGIAQTGGILGKVYSSGTATITNCYNTGDVTNSGTVPVGGILGNATNATITNCYNTGGVTGSGTVQSTEGMCVPAGGILGNATNATITNCYNTGDVTNYCSETTQTGGILGSTITGTITNCYNTGNINGSDSLVGGILGNGNSTNITYCYNTGAITGTQYPVGGIAGYCANITYSHNTGAVTGTNSNLVGEIIGSGTAGTGCTYGENVVAGTMDMSNFVTRMNEYVTTNNSNQSNTPLKTWKLENGYPVFAN